MSPSPLAKPTWSAVTLAPKQAPTPPPLTPLTSLRCGVLRFPGGISHIDVGNVSRLEDSLSAAYHGMVALREALRDAKPEEPHHPGTKEHLQAALQQCERSVRNLCTDVSSLAVLLPTGGSGLDRPKATGGSAYALPTTVRLCHPSVACSLSSPFWTAFELLSSLIPLALQDELWRAMPKPAKEASRAKRILAGVVGVSTPQLSTLLAGVALAPCPRC